MEPNFTLIWLWRSHNHPTATEASGNFHEREGPLPETGPSAPLAYQRGCVTALSSGWSYASGELLIWCSVCKKPLHSVLDMAASGQVRQILESEGSVLGLLYPSIVSLKTPSRTSVTPTGLPGTIAPHGHNGLTDIIHSQDKHQAPGVFKVVVPSGSCRWRCTRTMGL